MHNAVSLRERALNFILHHFNEVSKSAGFEELARANVDLILEII
jgi:hypothetical protein